MAVYNSMCFSTVGPLKNKCYKLCARLMPMTSLSMTNSSYKKKKTTSNKQRNNRKAKGS